MTYDVKARSNTSLSDTSEGWTELSLQDNIPTWSDGTEACPYSIWRRLEQAPV